LAIVWGLSIYRPQSSFSLQINFFFLFVFVCCWKKRELRSPFTSHSFLLNLPQYFWLYSNNFSRWHNILCNQSFRRILLGWLADFSSICSIFCELSNSFCWLFPKNCRAHTLICCLVILNFYVNLNIFVPWTWACHCFPTMGSNCLYWHQWFWNQNGKFFLRRIGLVTERIIGQWSEHETVLCLMIESRYKLTQSFV